MKTPTECILLSLILLIPQIYCALCPPSELLKPCTCEEDMLECSGYDNINLKEIFDKVSKNHGGKKFNEFILTNSAITELEDHVFADISFKKIDIIGALNLRRISSLALNASAFTAIEFRQIGENSLSDEYAVELFEALSSLVVVDRIFLDLTKVTKIPDNAFKLVNGRQTKLSSIHLNYVGAHHGNLQSVGSKPFYYLDNLKYISLANQQIKHLSANAFDFENPSKYDLNIHFEATQLTGESFKEGIFLNAKRPLTVELSRNKITYLDEKVFKPVFDLEETKMVQLILRENPLICDCKMKWFINNKTHLMFRVLEPTCNKGDLWTLAEKDFPTCSIE